MKKQHRPGSGFTKRYRWTKCRHKVRPSGKGHERRQILRAARIGLEVSALSGETVRGTIDAIQEEKQ